MSLLARYNGKPVGHILFTKAEIEGATIQPLIHILAPLAVIPDFQKQGIGGLLIRKGIQMLKEKGTKLVFVLGHKEYYPRHGFIQNAQGMGYTTPYPNPTPAEYAEYWMMQALTDEELVKGRIKCADALFKPEHWRE
ncbi:GNAT family N-acetyltransferase [Bacteroides sp. CG01]|uniref:GNAT family N-acetyltransferase n=1 Tax=Bacteroides TaxID=816 RepID=UPI00259CE975|nr:MULTISPECIES: N-acetyltransferase [Bacteroides]